MVKKFNPAPGWPAAPEGWLPFDGWQPDPSWPAAPEGWQFVVEDGTPVPRSSGAVSDLVKRAAEGFSARAKEADDLAHAPDVLWSAKGQPITGVGGGRFRLTALALFFERGILTTDAQQVPTHQLFDVDMRASLTQKARGVGDVLVHVRRPSGEEVAVLADVPNPREAVDIINRVAHEARLEAHRLANTRHHTADGAPQQAQPAPTPAATSPQPDAMEQLGKLGQLRDAGILTEEEFAAKKAEILARL